MKKFISLPRIVFLLVCIVGVIAISAFRQKEDTTAKKSTFRKEYKSGNEDTTTRSRRGGSITDKDVEKLEKAMKKLDEGMAKLEENTSKMDFEKMELDIQNAMKKVDWDKIEKEIEMALKNIDSDKMHADLKKQLQKVKEVDMVKVQEDLKKARHDFDKQKAELKLQSKEWKGQLEKEMKQAKESMEKAKAEMAEIKTFTELLEKDGLIDKAKGYKLEMKNGELIINGNKQPKEVQEKYQKYLKKGNFSIHVENGDKI